MTSSELEKLLNLMREYNIYELTLGATVIKMQPQQLQKPTKSIEQPRTETFEDILFHSV